MTVAKSTDHVDERLHKKTNQEERGMSLVVTPLARRSCVPITFENVRKNVGH